MNDSIFIVISGFQFQQKKYIEEHDLGMPEIKR